MDFIKYPSLTNSYKTDFLLSVQIGNNERPLDHWIVSEKIHGANFAIHYNPIKDVIKVASRNQFVGSDFYNNNEYIELHKDKLLSMCKAIVVDHDYMTLKIANKKQSEVVQITLYGELFGKGINKGVEYPNGRHFLLFDISTSVKPIKKEDIYRSFMDWSNVERYSKAHDVKTVPVMFKGRLDDCLNFNPEFRSIAGELVDASFNSSDDNLAEGIVIRPEETFYVRNERAILKNKIGKFKERVSKSKVRNDNSKIFVEHPNLENYIVDARLQNVLSKEDDIHTLNFQYVVQMFIIDILDDYCKDNNVVFEEKEDMKAVKKGLTKSDNVTELVRKAFGYV